MPEDLSRAVAAEIRRLMDARKVSGYALAKATGILSTQTVMRELKAAGVVRDKVKSRDGSIRPATANRPPHRGRGFGVRTGSSNCLPAPASRG